MTKKLVLTDDFFEAITLIKKQDLYFSNDVYQQILLKIKNLKIFPRMYPQIQTKQYLNQYRKIPIQRYIILYRIENDVIYIGSIISTKSERYNQLY